MQHDRVRSAEGGLDALFAEAASAARELARGEIALLRRELADNAGRMGAGVVAAVAAAFFGLAAIAMLCVALVDWLIPVTGSLALAALSVAAIAAAFGLVLALYARARLAGASLAPDRTRRSLARDGALFANRFRA